MKIFKLLFNTFFGNSEKLHEELNVVGEIIPPTSLKVHYYHKGVLLYKSICVGERVVCKSNEDVPYTIGTILDFIPLGRMGSTFVPLVRMEVTNEELMILGVCFPYDQEVCDELLKYDYKSQWNYLVGHHIQVKADKDGNPLVTFPENITEK